MDLLIFLALHTGKLERKKAFPGNARIKETTRESLVDWEARKIGRTMGAGRLLVRVSGMPAEPGRNKSGE